MLVLFLLAHHVLAKDTSNDSYIIKKIDSCPDEGYFFKRHLNFNTLEPNCYLCFCQDNGTAVCWPRENKRCDTKYYYHGGRRKREIRSRRSPGLSEIFFRDASRDIFNKQTPEQCKPYESSFSEGCPPADWCIGCTVCDCDANGRWDCHILSFCPDGKGKKKIKKRRSSVRSKITKRQATKKDIDKRKATKKTTTKKPTRRYFKKINKGKKPHLKQHKVKRINEKQKQKGKPNRRTQPKKLNQPCRKKVAKATKIKNKGKSTKPILKSSKSRVPNVNKDVNNDVIKDSTAKFAETILKRVMASVEKFIKESQNNSSKSTQSKVIKKRSMTKHKKANQKNSVGIDNNNKIKFKVLNKNLLTNFSLKKTRDKVSIYSRRKREAALVESQDSKKYILMTTVTNSTTKTGYYTYTEHLKDENKTTQNKSVSTERHFVMTTLNNTIDDVTTTRIDEEMTTQANGNISNKLHKSSKIFLNTNKDNESNLHFNGTSYKIFETCGKICELKKTIRKLAGSLNKRNTTRLPTYKVKANYNIFTHLNKIFRKIFLKKTNFKNVTIDGRSPFRKRKVIKVLCKNIGIINHTNKELQFKLDKLRAESLKILKSARVIKGLLKLLDLNENKSSNALNEKKFTDNDVNKLNVIVKDEYYSKYGLSNLTETQRIQINYIKENTLVFIQSIEKFSYILKDVINILTNGTKRNESYRCHNCSDNQVLPKINNNKTIYDKLKRLTGLLINYNLVQNKFMKRLYDVLITLEDKVNTTIKNESKEVSVENEKSNYTNIVENYTKNIFKNLRKLKDLAQRLSSKTRKKRAVFDNDDAIEYLLVLMEYLFKQTKPTNASPVRDGIDLLIEAIKNAPDIKTINTDLLHKNNSNNNKDNDAANNFHRNNLITDDNNDTVSFFNQKFKPYESTDNEQEEFNDYKDFNKDFQTSTRANHKLEVTTHDFDILIKKPTIVHVDDNDKIDINEKMITKEEVKRYEIFVDDTVEDDTPFDTTTTTIQADTSTATVRIKKLRTFTPDKKIPIHYEVNDSDNKIKLDWIEETYDNEQEREKITLIKETTTHTPEKTTKTIKKSRDKYADPVSSMSREDGERKYNTDNESYNKRTNILNSLDYITEKAFLDSDSREDKYNVDSSPLYFV